MMKISLKLSGSLDAMGQSSSEGPRPAKLEPSEN
jgi:hypothetical protein